jgi:hypothetical protein
LFISMLIIFAISVLAVIRYIETRTDLIRAKSQSVRILHLSIRIVQYLLLVNIIFVTSQVLLFSQHTTDSLTLTTFIIKVIWIR